MRRTPDVTRIEKPRTEARLVLDSMGQILNASDATHRLLGYRPGSLLGLFLAWITPPSRHGLLTQLSRAFDSARPLSLPTVIVRDDGSLLPVVLTTEPGESRRGESLTLTLEQDEEPTGKKPPSISQTFPLQRAAGPEARAQEPMKRVRRSPAQQPQTARPSTIRPTRISNLPQLEFPGRPIRQRTPPVAPPPASPVPDARYTPAPRRATSELAARGEDLSEQLTACLELLHWLDMQLERHKTPELVRDRALARVVVQEASALLDQCRAKVQRGDGRAR